MAANTHIEWTDATWNPVGGCAVCSPGCTNCYAQRLAARLPDHPVYKGVVSPSKAGPVFNGTLTRAPDDHPAWTWPLRWRGAKTPKLGAGKPSMIFVGDMCDLFHEDRPVADIDRVFAVMALCPQHIFQVLTKRSARMRDYCVSLSESEDHLERICDAAVRVTASPCAAHVEDATLPLPNVWFGVSSERQKEADERIPDLLQTPAAVRFISAEPLLGPVDLTRLGESGNDMVCDALRGEYFVPGCGSVSSKTFRGNRLDWVIPGGESGPNARPMHPDWPRSLRDQCAAAGVPFFFKQWGGWLPLGEDAATWGRDWFLIDKNGVDDLPDGRVPMYDEGEYAARRVGKKAAGHLLDGKECREFPEAQP